MMQRLLVWVIRSYVRGPGRSWIYTSMALLLFRVARRVTRRRPLVERLEVSSGDNLTIDQLEISHRSQIKQEKRARSRTLRRPRSA
jgi:hypothetical protein